MRVFSSSQSLLYWSTGVITFVIVHQYLIMVLQLPIAKDVWMAPERQKISSTFQNKFSISCKLFQLVSNAINCYFYFHKTFLIGLMVLLPFYATFTSLLYYIMAFLFFQPTYDEICYCGFPQLNNFFSQQKFLMTLKIYFC